MTFAGLAPGISSIALALMSLYISKETRMHRQVGGVFKMQSTLIYFVMAVAVCALLLSFYILYQPQYSGRREDALAPLSLVVICSVCALVWVSYEVRLETESLNFGIRGRRRLHYSQIVKIVDIRNQGSPRAILITRSGNRHGVWSNLLGYEALISELKIRCRCDYEKLEARGQKEQAGSVPHKRR